jgi:DNA polymerase-3 subunit alpha
LDKSYGILVYQEDILFTAIELAGYNWETVDKLRTAIGKKLPAEMAKQHEIFIEGCQTHSKMTKEEAEDIWNLFVPFQGYGFNKAHAAAYGMVSYQTAYLKAHYPVEYMTALLTAESGNTDKIVEAINECRRMKIVVLPPDINLSEAEFSIEENSESVDKKAIRFGLNAVKNVGEAALEEILKAREKGKFKSFCDFYLKVNGQKVNKKVLESLTKAGALDKFGKRSAILAGMDLNRQKCDLLLKDKSQGQSSLFETRGEDDKIIIPPDNFPSIEEFKKEELLQYEKELLGFYLKESPLTSKLSFLENEVGGKIADIIFDQDNIGQKVKVGGMITDLRVILTKKSNSEMAFVTIQDDTEKIELVVFPKIYGNTKSIWTKDNVVIIDGKLECKDKDRDFTEMEDMNSDSFSIIVDSAKNAQESPEAKYDFYVRIPKGIGSSILVGLNKILKENTGDQFGVLIFENGTGVKKLALTFGVNYSNEVKDQITQLLKK